jgi:dihydroorotase/N-acyl-D-amino-acid deacylase
MIALLAACCAAAVAWMAAQTPTFDLLIRNGRIVDGTGTPWFQGDVAVRGDQIAVIAPHVSSDARRTIDAGGHIVAPGPRDRPRRQ